MLFCSDKDKRVSEILSVASIRRKCSNRLKAISPSDPGNKLSKNQSVNWKIHAPSDMLPSMTSLFPPSTTCKINHNSRLSFKCNGDQEYPRKLLSFYKLLSVIKMAGQLEIEQFQYLVRK